MDSAAGARAWGAAQRLIGVPFRLHGRDPANGLDCVGLVAAAYAAAGVQVANVPDRYRLSGPTTGVAQRWLAACGAVPAKDAAAPGDVLLADLGDGVRRQLHLLILGPGGAIHAHAGLRRVVLTPEPDVKQSLGRWRIIGGLAPVDSPEVAPQRA